MGVFVDGDLSPGAGGEVDGLGLIAVVGIFVYALSGVGDVVETGQVPCQVIGLHPYHADLVQLIEELHIPTVFLDVGELN